MPDSAPSYTLGKPVICFVRVVLIALLCCACSRGAGSRCALYPDGHSDCAEGFICDTLQDGYMERRGNNVVIKGRCAPAKKAGDQCAQHIDNQQSECATPLRCVEDEPQGTLGQQAMTGPPPWHCR